MKGSETNYSARSNVAQSATRVLEFTINGKPIPGQPPWRVQTSTFVTPHGNQSITYKLPKEARQTIDWASEFAADDGQFNSAGAVSSITSKLKDPVDLNKPFKENDGKSVITVQGSLHKIFGVTCWISIDDGDETNGQRTDLKAKSYALDPVLWISGMLDPMPIIVPVTEIASVLSKKKSLRNKSDDPFARPSQTAKSFEDVVRQWTQRSYRPGAVTASFPDGQGRNAHITLECPEAYLPMTIGAVLLSDEI